MRKIIYIAGYGRSGSTLIGTVLGNHPEICNAGELTFISGEDFEKDCACGTKLKECDFWKSFIEKELYKEINLVSFESDLALYKLLLKPLFRTAFDKYSMYNFALFEHIQQASSKEMVIDSSKTARAAALRFLLLSKVSKADVYVLHVVRSGFSVLESLKNVGSNWQLEGRKAKYYLPVLRTTIGWTVANTRPLLYRYFIPKNRYRRVRYEDFINNPSSVLLEIGDFLGEDFSSLSKKSASGEEFESGCVLGGNRLRFQKKVVIQQSGYKVTGNGLSRIASTFFLLISWPLLVLFKYQILLKKFRFYVKAAS